MKILQVCHKPPFPKVDGGCFAMANLTSGLLNNGHQVKVLTISTYKHPFNPKDFPIECKPEGVFVDIAIKPINASFNLIKGTSYNISRFVSRKFQNKLKQTLESENFDIVLLESLFVVPYLKLIRSHTNAKVIYRAHNVEFYIWENLADATRKKVKKAYISTLAKQLKKYEIGNLNSYDAIAAITANDQGSFEKLGCKIPIHVAPFGIELPKKSSGIKTNKEVSVGFLAALDWNPNLDGLNWFLEEVWPIVTQQNDKITLHIAGRAMPKKLVPNKTPNVKLHGEVSSAAEFMCAHDIFIVPLHSGGGVRVKIIEAMALGRAIISTTKGAQGISYQEDQHLLIADSSKEFANKIISLSQDEKMRINLAKTARELVISKYNNASVCADFADFMGTLQAK